MQHEVVSGKPHFPSNAQPLSAVNLPQNLPRSGVVQFVGRQTKMDELHEKLQQNEHLAITAVKGMGGIGKTELALQYCYQHYKQDTYSGGICWLRSQEQDVGTQIVKFATAQLDLKPPEGLDLPTQLAYCWRRWREGDVLIVFDNVTKYQDIAPYLPPREPRFKVLLTTRKELGKSVQSFPIDVLDESQALELLNSLVQDGRIEQQVDDAKALCLWLGYLPLGLELVGRYLARKPDLSLSEMRKRLEKQALNSKALSETEDGMTAPLGVQAAIDLSWQELDERARELAYLLSLFASAPVPWGLVQSCLSDRGNEEIEDLRDELVKLSLLKRTGKGVYQLHQLLREFFREKLDSSEETGDLKRAYCRALGEEAKQIPQGLTREVVERVLPVIPHLAEVATTLLPWLENENLVWPFVGLGRFYAGQGAYAQAQPWFEQCLAICQERLGEEHPDVAQSLNNLAELYRNQGRYDQAEPLHKRALAIYEEVLGPKHRNVATILNNLSELYRNQGRYDQGEPLYKRALAIYEEVLGPKHPDVATSLNGLALLYDNQGRYDQAEPLLEKALAIQEKALGPEHPDVATSLNNLALLYDNQGRYDQAEPLVKRALTIQKKVLGPEHPDIGQSLNNLAGLYRNQGRYGQAESLFKRALDIREKALGPEHPNVVESLNNLAVLYFSQGRYAQAEPLYKRALDIQEKVLGPEHPNTVAVRQNYTGFLKRKKKRKKGFGSA
jgi:tetratricopeptide (TPR) repeat protein